MPVPLCGTNIALRMKKKMHACVGITDKSNAKPEIAAHSGLSLKKKKRLINQSIGKYLFLTASHSKKVKQFSPNRKKKSQAAWMLLPVLHHVSPERTIKNNNKKVFFPFDS